MELRTLLPTLWILVGLTEAGLQTAEEPGYPRTAGSTQRNLTAADVTGEGAKTNIIVAVFFIGMVTLLMTISLYCTLTRKGCGRYKWKKQVDEESLS